MSKIFFKILHGVYVLFAATFIVITISLIIENERDYPKEFVPTIVIRANQLPRSQEKNVMDGNYKGKYEIPFDTFKSLATESGKQIFFDPHDQDSYGESISIKYFFITDSNEVITANFVIEPGIIKGKYYPLQIWVKLIEVNESQIKYAQSTNTAVKQMLLLITALSLLTLSILVAIDRIIHI